MKPDRPNLPALLTLTQREHQRLNNQIKRLQTYALDEEDLQKYRTYWLTKLGQEEHTAMLIQAVDTLIDALVWHKY